MTDTNLVTGRHHPARGHAAFGWRGRRRRVQAARIARLLLPGATAAGGFVSTELTVALPEGTTGRPDVAVSRRDPPVDGLLTRAPDLVVLIDHGSADERRALHWLTMGTPAVWHLAAGVVFERRQGLVRRRMPGQVLRVPRLPGVAVTVDALLATAQVDA